MYGVEHPVTEWTAEINLSADQAPSHSWDGHPSLAMDMIN